MNSRCRSLLAASISLLSIGGQGRLIRQFLPPIGSQLSGKRPVPDCQGLAIRSYRLDVADGLKSLPAQLLLRLGIIHMARERVVQHAENIPSLSRPAEV